MKRCVRKLVIARRGTQPPAMARFLVIDDDNTIRQLMVATLQSAGHEVLAAATGAEGVALFEGHRPDVVITDIVLPDDSLDQVFALRRSYPDVPFIVVSGLAAQSPRTLEVATQLAARRMLSKPFGLPDLLGATDEVLAELRTPKKGWKFWR